MPAEGPSWRRSSGRRRPPRSPTAGSSSQSEPAKTGPRVLIVEDDLVSASALSAILGRRGFEVCHAATVEQGFALLASEGPATVILDLMLPDGDGAAILEHIRRTGSAARVIVTTAVHEGDRLAAVRELAPEVVLQKPIDLGSLLRVLGPLN